MREGGKKTLKKNIKPILGKVNEGDEKKNIGQISGKVNGGWRNKNEKNACFFW